MFEKVNPSHPDKVADRIAGAIVDLAYLKEENPRIAVEVLIGHNLCTIIAESSVSISKKEVKAIVNRIHGKVKKLKFVLVKQDVILSKNQDGTMRCGDNGIFKGTPVTEEQQYLTDISREIYKTYKTDGKYVVSGKNLVICQSNATYKELAKSYSTAKINPLGFWTGGTKVDTGATNRKLGSDMGDSVTGGGIHGKDLSKADVSVNIYAWLKAQKEHKNIELSCAIGDEIVDGKSYKEIVDIAKKYIESIGGFEKFAEWGFIR